mmetsp:Transcript_25743/g.84403  ORF Transcript_25743/g.84403 Transcript_25743/m.84403 type:complete len:350 (-) Transcript_25743:563-1612(-)
MRTQRLCCVLRPRLHLRPLPLLLLLRGEGRHRLCSGRRLFHCGGARSKLPRRARCGCGCRIRVESCALLRRRCVVGCCGGGSGLRHRSPHCLFRRLGGRGRFPSHSARLEKRGARLLRHARLRLGRLRLAPASVGATSRQRASHHRRASLCARVAEEPAPRAGAAGDAGGREESAHAHQHAESGPHARQTPPGREPPHGCRGWGGGEKHADGAEAIVARAEEEPVCSKSERVERLRRDDSRPGGGRSREDGGVRREEAEEAAPADTQGRCGAQAGGAAGAQRALHHGPGGAGAPRGGDVGEQRLRRDGDRVGEEGGREPELEADLVRGAGGRADPGSEERRVRDRAEDR